ncbi:MAG: uridine diphosphate-N-acetylglucosamine-binding protein YvcK [Actinobacteria bacterium]|nr:uridine diphosphate-N-acetylglucosamine-binding protein YvcK [Actinomycetota bacterium]
MLSALRDISSEITAVVTVADNGGSSGQLRSEFGVMPPGDLRMALSALCSDDEWGSSWAQALQHRFESEGPLNGHALGNLLLTALWNLNNDPVVGLDKVGELLRIVGRVLPMAAIPIEIEATLKPLSNGQPGRVIRGQVEVAEAAGEVVSVRLIPDSPPVLSEVLEAIENAEWITIGPGSWYSSVLPHLLVPQIRTALANSNAKIVVFLNLDARTVKDEASALSPEVQIEFLKTHAPEVKIDYLVADNSIKTTGLEAIAQKYQAQLILSDLAHHPGSDQHDRFKVLSTLKKLIG